MSASQNNVFEPRGYHEFYSLFQAYNAGLASLVRTLVGSVPGTIVDLACGTGLSTAAIRKSWPEASIVGVDISDEMVCYARENTSDANCRFQCGTVSETVKGLAESPASLFFVKSAYHYFEDEMSPGDMAASLIPGGVFVVAERTARSASSYPLPGITRAFWTDFFSQSTVDRRIAAAERHALELSVTSYGKWVEIPAFCYQNGVRDFRLFGLSATAPAVVEQWLADNQADSPVKVWEEFWLYVYRKPINAN